MHLFDFTLGLLTTSLDLDTKGQIYSCVMLAQSGFGVMKNALVLETSAKRRQMIPNTNKTSSNFFQHTMTSVAGISQPVHWG